MKYKIEFQYKSKNSASPDDAVQVESIEFEHGEAIPIPNVGDSVSYEVAGVLRAFKIISRHFSYYNGWCDVNIVVSDIASNEMAARLKM